MSRLERDAGTASVLVQPNTLAEEDGRDEDKDFVEQSGVQALRRHVRAQDIHVLAFAACLAVETAVARSVEKIRSG